MVPPDVDVPPEGVVVLSAAAMAWIWVEVRDFRELMALTVLMAF